MGYDFSIRNYYKIKYKEKEYDWPCESEPNRKITLFDDDILTKSENGTFMKHTGLCCSGIKIPKKDLIFYNKKKIKLRFL